MINCLVILLQAIMDNYSSIYIMTVKLPIQLIHFSAAPSLTNKSISTYISVVAIR